MIATNMNATAFEDPAGPPPSYLRPLPFRVIATARRAYADVVANPGVVLRLLSAWTILLTMISVAALGVFGLMLKNGSIVLAVQPGAISAGSLPASGALVGPGVALGAIALGGMAGLATCSVFVGWFKFLLAGERPARIYLAAGATVWRYAWATTVLFAVLCLAVFPMAIAVPPLVAISGSANLGQLATGLMTLAATIAASRLMVAMPAVALGRQRELRGAWSKTRGFTWPIALTTIVVMLPWQIIVQLWSVVVPAGAAPEMTPAVIALIFAGAIAWVVSVLAGASVAAAAYRHFVEPARS